MNIGIIGAGCIGSSLARDIKEKNLGTVFISDQNLEYLEICEKTNLADRCFSDSQELAQECDIIFVCVPVISIPNVIKSIAPHTKPGTIITDVGSVKSSIMEEVKAYIPDTTYFVPGHPITSGTIEVGPEAGREGVFEDVTYILTPWSDTPDDAVQKLSDLVQKLGSNIVVLDADKHDTLLGFTSHLSHVVAFSVMNSAAKLTDRLNEDVTEFAGGSFKDLTRVAASDVEMWRDIFLSNKKHIKSLYQLLVEEMNQLNELIESDDKEGLEAFIRKASDLRRNSFQ